MSKNISFLYGFNGFLSPYKQQGKSSVYIYTKPTYPTKPIVCSPHAVSRNLQNSPNPIRRTPPLPSSFTSDKAPVPLKFRTSCESYQSHPLPNSNNFLTTCFLTLGRPKHRDNLRARGGKQIGEEALNLEVVMNAWEKDREGK